MTDVFARLTRLGRLAERGGPRRLVLAAAVLVLLGGVFPAYLGIELTRGLRDAPGSTYGAEIAWADLMAHFARQGFDLDAEGGAPLAVLPAVPRIFIGALPHDWPALGDPGQRKRAFTTALLPLVLRANHMLLERRGRLLEIAEQGRISARDRAWLEALAVDYGLEPSERPERLMEKLALMVDIVPPSLALAQGAIESGWGTSRFAAEGNALYGQWAEEGEGAMVPAERAPGRTYAIKRFDTLQGSVLAYMHNLNTHRAYRAFRAARATLRESGRPISGAALAKHLGAYSERGAPYIAELIAIMEQNALGALDAAKLSSRSDRDTPAPVPGS